MDPRMRELVMLSALAALGCAVAAAQGDLLFVALFGASVVAIIEASAIALPASVATKIERLAGSIIRQEIELEAGSWRDVEEHAEICYRSRACGVSREEHRL